MKFDFDDAVYYDMRGHVKHAAGQYAQAVADYSEAIRKKPTCAAHYAGRADAEYALKQYERTVEDYKKAIELEPYESSYYANLGSAYLQLKKGEEAAQCFSKAIDIEPFAGNYSNLAVAILHRGNDVRQRRADAVKMLDMAIQKEPSFAPAWRNRGYLKYYMSQMDSAIADYDEAIAIDPENASYYRERGEIKTACKEYL